VGRKELIVFHSEQTGASITVAMPHMTHDAARPNLLGAIGSQGTPLYGAPRAPFTLATHFLAATPHPFAPVRNC